MRGESQRAKRDEGRGRRGRRRISLRSAQFPPKRPSEAVALSVGPRFPTNDPACLTKLWKKLEEVEAIRKGLALMQELMSRNI